MSGPPEPDGGVPTLPRALVDQVFALLFGDPERRAAAFAQLVAANPEHAEALQAHFRRQLEMEGLEDSEVAVADGMAIPGYRLLSVLGEGGMGTVWRAEQQSPVHRLVALKVIKRGMDSKAVLVRFEQERQALAAMDHDAIAKVFDCGTTPRGQPYFAMELVEGLPIQSYCDERRLSLRQRIELFQQACQGVQHAHLKGVIHRDLKPGNVLVVAQEGRHAVKIIDFGVARATDRRLSVGSLFTEEGMIVGTPEYMSPEQAAGDVRRIDMRTDVYSLGVILYELLVGELPFPSVELRAAALAEVQRRLCEDEPPKPSTRLSTMGALAAACAARRGISADALRRELAGDLDWVVLRAMAKEPQRRYESPTALAEDLRRYLVHEPVLAGPPSSWYRAKKLLRRHRGLVVGASAVLVTLVGGGIGTFVQYVRAEEKAADAMQQKGEAEQRAWELAQVLAFEELQWSKADPERMGANLRRAVLSEAKAEHREDLEASLDGVNFTNLALGMLRGDLFDPSLAAIAKGFDEQPIVKARLLGSVAGTLFKLGLWDHAKAPLTEALDIHRRLQGGDHQDVLDWTNSLCALLREQGKLAEAEGLCRETTANCRRILGDDHAYTLDAITNLGWLLMAREEFKEAEPLLREALERRRRTLGDDDERTLTSISYLGTLLWKRGEYGEAEQLYGEVLAKHRKNLGDDHPETLNSLHHMGVLLQLQGKLTEAEPYCREALEKRRRFLGDDHTNTLKSISNMAQLLSRQARYSEAELLYREAMERSRRVLGDKHPYTLTAISDMSSHLGDQGRYVEAEPLCREALEKRRRFLGDDHPDTLTSLNNLGMLLDSLDKLAEAEPFLREALEKRRRFLGDDHPTTLLVLNNLGMLLQTRRNFAEAELLLREALERRRRVLGNDHPDLLVSINNLGLLLGVQGRAADAEPLCREALERSRRQFGDDHPGTLKCVNNVGMALLEQGKLAEAEPFCREALEKSRHGIGDDHPDTLGKMGTMTALLKAQGKFAEAEVLGREQLERLRRVLGDDHATTRTSIYNLGYLLRAQGKLAEAEPLCRESMERYRRILGDDDPRALTTIQSMGTLLVETERHGEAVALLSATEAAARRTFTGDSADRLASYLLALGKAQAGLARPPDLATAEAKLLEAHAIASAGRGSTHETARACAKALVELYGVWHAAEPGSGRDRQRAEWQAKLDSLPRIRK